MSPPASVAGAEKTSCVPSSTGEAGRPVIVVAVKTGAVLTTLSDVVCTVVDWPSSSERVRLTTYVPFVGAMNEKVGPVAGVLEGSVNSRPFRFTLQR